MSLSSSSPLIRTPCLPAEVLDCLAEGVVVIGQEGNIIFTNPSFERLFGYDPGELLGQHASVLNRDRPEEPTTVETLMSRVLSQGVWQGEVLNRKKDGTPFTTYARATIFEMDGTDYYVSAQEDITQHRCLDVQFHERERLALIGTIAVNMSHEIGNRLNSLSSSVQMLERSFTKPKESLSLSDMAEIVQDLKAETSRMEEVLWALRELSIPDRIFLRPVDVGQVARRVLQTQYVRCTEHQIQQVSSFPEPVPLVLADQERLTQVLDQVV